jgi:hypothetical protein
VTWAVREKGYSQRRACSLASRRRRFGYRRLGLMLERQGVKLSPKKLYRLYKEEQLTAAVASERSAHGRRWRSHRLAICVGRSTSLRTPWLAAGASAS